MSPNPPRPDLAGLSVLIVEDETLVLFLVEDMLSDLGCQDVRHAGRVGEALVALDGWKPDLAVLDVNVAGETVFPVAEALAAMGAPFVFTTGYGRAGLPEAWSSRPVAPKPFELDGLARAISEALTGARISRPVEG